MQAQVVMVMVMVMMVVVMMMVMMVVVMMMMMMMIAVMQSIVECVSHLCGEGVDAITTGLYSSNSWLIRLVVVVVGRRC